MSRLVIVVEKASDWGSYYPSADVVTAMDYLRQPVGSDDERTQVINLCRSYKYLGTGYYVSLLAEARGHKVIPSVRTVNDLRRRSLYGLDIDDLNQKLAKFLPAGGRDTTDFGVLVYFGETAYGDLQDLARQVFDMFPCPLMRIEFERDRVWQVSAIKAVGLHTLDDAQEDAFALALDNFSRKVWRKPRTRRRFRYDLAMLVDPNEQMPPSNKKALKQFIEAGKHLGMEVDPIGKNDYQRLAEYDGLFIRETTASDNHTYRFAHRAEKEGMVVMDDPTSILRCTNKIFLNDLDGLAQAGHADHGDPLPRRPQAPARPARTPGPAHRAEDPRWLVLARRGEGGNPRGTGEGRQRTVLAQRAADRAGIPLHGVRLAHRRAQPRAACTHASTSCRAATGRSTTTAPRARRNPAAFAPCPCGTRPPRW